MEFKKDKLDVKVFKNRTLMGEEAGRDFASTVRELLKEKEYIRVIFAAAPSQNDFLKAIVNDKTIDFSRIDAFHMDEYVGLSPEAPQGFGNFLRDRIFSLRDFHSVSYLSPDSTNPLSSCKSYAALLNEAPIDIVCMGIGENGHIAFNDPAFALFDDKDDVKIVILDNTCRMQQVHDGCFKNIDEVPKKALTLTIPMLMKAKYHFCMVPALTKAKAVKEMLEGEINEKCPCTILRTKENSILYLDRDSSSLLETK